MKYILISLILVFSTYTKKTELGLNLNVGETYSQTYVSKNTITQKINGMEQVISIEISGGMNFNVIENLGDKYAINTSYSSLTMKMNLPTGEMVFSSKKEESDIFSTILKNMVGKEFKIEMLRNGTISKIENLDNLFDSMFDSFPEIPELQKQQILAQLRQAYGEKAFKGNIEMITAIFPNQKVKVGDSWKNSIKLESGMSGFINNTFTLTKVNSDNIIINGTAAISTEDKDAYININGMPTRYNMKGKMTTSYKLDPKTNWIIEGSIKQEISGEVHIKDNPNLPGGMIIPMVMNNNMTVGQ